MLAAAAALLLTATASPADRAATGPNRVVAYVPNWNDVSALAETIDYTHLTHINIAFENPSNPEGDLSFNPKNDLLIARAHKHHVPVLISIGGGSASEDKPLLARYFDLISEAKRAAFVAKLADYVTSHHFDGLDVDLEGPAINPDYGAFIQDLSRVLKPRGKLLTAALSQGYGGKSVPDSVFARFDWVNIMAYDGTGPWNPNAPGQHSSREFARSNVDYWLKRGLPKRKAVLGVPFYGYGFGEAFRKGDYPYSELVASYPGAENGDQVGNTIWYNGLPTIKAKAEYVKAQGLGGMMIWSLDSDVPGEKSLLTTIAKALGR
jgi:chitinase